MLKRFLSLAIAMLAMMSAGATSLEIKTADGKSTVLNVSDELVIAMTPAKFTVDGTDSPISFDLDNVVSFCYTDLVSVEGIHGDDVKVNIRPDHIDFEGTRPSDVKIYSIDGRLVEDCSAIHGSIYLTAYPAGCYIIVFDGRSVKFTVK